MYSSSFICAHMCNIHGVEDSLCINKVTMRLEMSWKPSQEANIKQNLMLYGKIMLEMKGLKYQDFTIKRLQLKVPQQCSCGVVTIV